MVQILSQWQAAYRGFCEEEETNQSTIKEAKKSLSEAPPPYKGLNFVRRFREGKAHKKFVETTEARIQEAEKALETARRDIGLKTLELFVAIFPSSVMASIDGVILKKEALDASALRRDLIKCAHIELEQVRVQVLGAGLYENYDGGGGNEQYSLHSHYKTYEAAVKLEHFSDVLGQFAEQLGCNSVHQEIKNPLEGWSCDIDILAGCTDYGMSSNGWASYLNAQKLGVITEQLYVIGPQFDKLNWVSAQDFTRHNEEFIQAHKDCMSVLLGQIDKRVVNSEQAGLLKRAITNLPVNVLFSKEAIALARKTRPAVGRKRTPLLYVPLT